LNLCFLQGSSDAGIQNVIIDTLLVCPDQTGGSFNISLGSLAQGYHLLEVSYLGSASGGSINFTVVTAAGEAARLDRFRICVPSYSSTTESYTVISMTNFTMSDRYFIKGFASECIDNIKFGGGWLYKDWQWEWSTGYNHDGWGDGFNVPIPWLDQSGPRSIEFRYNATNSGTLDFSDVSFTGQPSMIEKGTPEFWASVMALPPIIGTISNETLCAGSKWYIEPGTSERKIIVSQQFCIAKYAYDGGPLLWDARIRFDVSIARLDAVLNSETSFAIAINVTYLGGVIKPVDSVWVTLVAIDVRVPSQVLNVLYWEYHNRDGEKSIVNTDYTIATSMVVAGTIAYALTFANPVGAVVGFAVGGAMINGILDYFEGTSVSPFTSQLTTDTEACAFIESMGSAGSGQSVSEIGFVRVKPMQTNHCGFVRTQVDALLNGAHVFTYIDFPVYDSLT
jgi:hypothetical protein